jgi:hypothetical protein
MTCPHPPRGASLIQSIGGRGWGEGVLAGCGQVREILACVARWCGLSAGFGDGGVGWVAVVGIREGWLRLRTKNRSPRGRPPRTREGLGVFAGIEVSHLGRCGGSSSPFGHAQWTARMKRPERLGWVAGVRARASWHVRLCNASGCTGMRNHHQPDDCACSAGAGSGSCP